MTTGQGNLSGILKKIAFFAIIVLGTVQNIAAGSLSVYWSPISDNRVAGYKVKYGTQSGSYQQSVDVGNSISCVVANLTEGATYFFRVTAYDSNRTEGTPSAEVSAVVLKVLNPATTSINSTSAVIAWQTNKPATSQVEYGTTAAYGSATVLNTGLTLSPTQSLLNLLPTTLYHFRVRSQDEGGSTSLSSDYAFTTAADTAGSGCDANGDGITNAMDVQVVINAILAGGTSPSLDITKDGKIDVSDLQMLGNVVLGVSSCP